MADFLAGYVVPAGAGLADDPGLKASQRSTGGALSVFVTRVGAGPPLHVHDREEAARIPSLRDQQTRCRLFRERERGRVGPVSRICEFDLSAGRYCVGERWTVPPGEHRAAEVDLPAREHRAAEVSAIEDA